MHFRSSVKSLYNSSQERGLVLRAYKWATSLSKGYLTWYPYKSHPTGSCSKRGCAVSMPRYKAAKSGGNQVAGLDHKS